MPLFNPTQQLNLNYAGLMSSANDSANTATKIFQNLAQQHQANQDKTKAEYSKFNTNALISKVQGIDTSLTLGQQQQKRQEILDSIGSNQNLNFDAINQVVGNSVKYGQDVFNKKRAFDETVKQDTAQNSYNSQQLTNSANRAKSAELTRLATLGYQQKMLALKNKQLTFDQNNSPIALQARVNKALHDSIETSTDANGNTVKNLNMDNFNDAVAGFPASYVKTAVDGYRSNNGLDAKSAQDKIENEHAFKVATQQSQNLLTNYKTLKDKIATPTNIPKKELESLVETYGNALDYFKTTDGDRNRIRPALQAMLRAGMSLKDTQANVAGFRGFGGLTIDDLVAQGNDYSVRTLNTENKANAAFQIYNKAMNSSKGNQ